jgi:hypothetical protein
MKRIIFILLLFIGMHSVAQKTEQLYLSGTDSKQTVQWDFFCTDGRRSNSWEKIDVPSCWEQQGFGNYNYGRDYKTNGKNSRFADESGLYKYAFTVPQNWKGKSIDIVFEGSMTDTEVKVNGKLAGATHQGSFYRFSYDVTALLKPGAKNLLEVKVSKMSKDASVNNAERLADYWVFGGIFRPVYLEAKPLVNIERVGIDATHKGDFSMQVQTSGSAAKGSIVATIFDAAKNIVATAKFVLQANDSLVNMATKVKAAMAWAAENPVLYTVQVALFDAAGKKKHEVSEKFGFRTVEVRKGMGVFVNDVQVKFKGVNRHCFWPETGRSLSREQQVMDVRLLKEMNMNAVRCSHYPPDKYFLQLCDSLGIYVIDELAGWQKAYSTKAGKPLVKEMVERDMNHPSIVLWANGNEGGTNKELDAVFTQFDIQKRTVIHPHHRPGNQFNGIDCNHYEDYYSTKKILQDSLIYMPTEFLHAQDDGGGAAAMEDFWNLHWSAPRSAGGFIWAFADEAIVRTDMNNVLDANGLNANDGILGPHREKEGSYYALREIFSPVKLDLPKRINSDFDGKISIENRFHFTNTAACTFNWELVDFSGPFDRSSGYVVRKKGRAISPNINSTEKGILQLDLGNDFLNHDALLLIIKDNRGNEIGRWTTMIRSNESILKRYMTVKKDSTAVAYTDTSYVLSGGDVSIEIDKRNGQLIRSRNKMNDYVHSFTNGPILVRGDAIFENTSILQKENATVATFNFKGNLKKIEWSINANGWVRLHYAYALEGDHPFSGVSFSYPENYVLGSKWLGKGPSRQWKNRMAGTPVNVWQNLYNNTQTGYAPNTYPEFKGYFGEVAWMELSTVEGKIFIASPDDGLFVRLFDFNGLTTTGKAYPQLPPGNISFLDCIPPIGTKLAMGVTSNAAVYGPQGEMNHLKGLKSRTLYFYFGLPKITDSKEQYTRPLIDNVF